MFLSSWRQRGAAKKYASVLPSWLAQAYGRRDLYTEAQLRRAVAETGLNSKFIVFALAAYLPKSEFEAIVKSLPVKLDYETAREVFDEFVPVLVDSASTDPVRLNPDAYWGASGDR